MTTSALQNTAPLAPQKLKGIEKAAVLLLALPDNLVVKVFSKLDVIEVKELSQRMAILGRVRADTVETLLMDFVEQVGSSGLVYGSYENTERLLDKLFDKTKVKEIMDEIRGPAGRTMWEKLGNVSEDVLASFLKNEYPQTIAVVLSKIKPEHAARVFGLLPENIAYEVMNRMLRMEVVQKDILNDVENTLRVEFMTNLARTSQKDPHEQMAEIFNSFDRSVEGKFMSALENKNPESAERIKSLMFTFDDLMKLDTSGIQTLIRVVDKEKLVLALKGTSDGIKDLFFKNMSERSRKLMKDEMQDLGMVRLRAVDEAQQEIVLATKDLISRGEINMAEGGADDELIG
ncbi:MAG: flagellar motor switch protein FliG [Janthinobacterium lividum]